MFHGVGSVTAQRDKKDPGALRSAGLLLSIPTLLIVSPLVGFFVGSWLDNHFRTSPWLTIAGLVLGFVAGGQQTYRIYRLYQAEEEEQKGRR
jgi:F0F1-type ATP synthase assembly protein I